MIKEREGSSFSSAHQQEHETDAHSYNNIWLCRAESHLGLSCQAEVLYRAAAKYYFIIIIIIILSYYQECKGWKFSFSMISTHFQKFWKISNSILCTIRPFHYMLRSRHVHVIRANTCATANTLMFTDLHMGKFKPGLMRSIHLQLWFTVILICIDNSAAFMKCKIVAVRNLAIHTLALSQSCVSFINKKPFNLL